MDSFEYTVCEIVNYGKLREIYNDIVYLQGYMKALKKLGEERIEPPPHVPRQLFNEIAKGSQPRLGPLKVKGSIEVLIEELGATVKCPRADRPFHAIVDFSSGIKVMVAFQRERSIVGVDLGVRHIATVLALRGTRTWKLRFFDNPHLTSVIHRYTGEPQGQGMQGELRRLVKNETDNITDFISTLFPRVVIIEDLRSVEGRVGTALRIIQDELIKSLYEKGIKFRRMSAFNTSKICSKCGYRKGEVVGSIFVCPACGFRADRDYNAAYNLALKGYFLA